MERLKQLKRQSIFGAIVVVLLIVIGFTGGGRKSFQWLERISGDIFSPVISVTSQGVQKVVSGVNTIIHLPQLEKENKEMKQEVARLSEENRRLNDIISRTDYLRSEAKLQSSSKFSMVKAKVIGKNPGAYFSKLLLNKGIKDGIQDGDTVVVGIDGRNGVIVEGLVGKVVEVGDNWCNVDSIFNEGNSVAFRNIRTQDGGVLTGNSEGSLEGYSYDPYGDIVTNDRLITSGIGDLYKGDLFIGTVTAVHRDEDEMVQHVEVSPAVNFMKIYQVFVIKE
ncbi:MAG: rod shape-determining protein MreC [Tissierellia bacterium]|nr:rod shape-determining protein MreC [Tissierellia bacterium]